MNRRSGYKIMSKLITLIKPLIHYIIFAVVMGVLGFLCAIFIPVFGVIGILTVLGINFTFSIKTIFTVLILLAVFRGILRYGEQACNHYIAFRILAVIRDKVFTVLRKLCPAKLEGEDKGNLISLITSDVELLEVFYAHTISPILIALTVSIIMVLFIGSFSPILGIIAILAYFFVGVIIPVVNSKKIKNSGLAYRNKAGELNSLFLDSLRGLQELLQFSFTEERKSEIAKKTSESKALHKKLKIGEISSRNFTEGTVFVFNIIMIITASILYFNNKIDFSEMVISITALVSSYGPVIALSNLSNNLAQTLASGDRVISLLEEEPVVAEIENGIDKNFDEIECKNLSFSYDSIKILDNISIKIEKNKITGILGKSGCGKSTLLNLLAGMLTPESGTLLLNGTPLTADSRRHIGYMLQQDYLLEWRSIWKNVLLGLEIRHELTEESRAYAKQLLKQYGLKKFSQSKPSQLSGGMRQRAALVRTLVLKPELLLLDEPFSALDYQTRLSVSNDIGSIIRKEKKTAILVTHDLAEAVSMADRVIILTARPGRIQRIVSVAFPTDLTPMERRDHDDFKTYFNLIWKELHHETS